jgi:hypothetical protein
MGTEGASCFRLLSGEERELDEQEWEQERFGMICSKAEAFTNLKSVALKLCATTGRCTYDERESLIRFEDKIYRIQEKINGEHDGTHRQD